MLQLTAKSSVLVMNLNPALERDDGLAPSAVRGECPSQIQV
jgi:hypothetical protein